MRVTLNLDADLLRRAKRLAATSHRTLASVLEDALREALARANASPPEGRVKLPVSDCEPGLLPGVNLDKSAALLDVMDRGNASGRR